MLYVIAEQLVRRALHPYPEDLVIATKAGLARTGPGKWHPLGRPEYHKQQAEMSLRNLGLETIDVQQMHVWSDEWVGQGDWLEGIERLKRDGKIRFFGVSINDHQPANAIALVRSGLVDTVQVIYNVFDQSPEDELFPAVEEAGVGVGLVPGRDVVASDRVEFGHLKSPCLG